MNTIEILIDGQRLKYNTMKNDIIIGDVVAVKFENLIRVSKIDKILETFYFEADMILGFLEFGNLEFESAYQFFDADSNKFSYKLRTGNRNRTLDDKFLDYRMYDLVNRKTVFINNDEAFLLYIKYEDYYLHSSIIKIEHYHKYFSEYPRILNSFFKKSYKLDDNSFVFKKTEVLRSPLYDNIKYIKNKLLSFEQPRYILCDLSRFNSYDNLYPTRTEIPQTNVGEKTILFDIMNNTDDRYSSIHSIFYSCYMYNIYKNENGDDAVNYIDIKDVLMLSDILDHKHRTIFVAPIKIYYYHNMSKLYCKLKEV